MNFPLTKGLFNLLLIWCLALPALAAEKDPPLPETFATHKIVLQISDNDPTKQTMVLNVANNLINHYGVDDIDIEIVAFGPGVRLMLKDNANEDRMKGMMKNGVRFSACRNTLNMFTKKLGYTPDLVQGVTVVPAGAARVLQLNAAGYQTLKP